MHNKATCPVCGNEFVYVSGSKSQLDVGKVPPNCGKKICQTNFQYAKKHTKNEGDIPSARALEETRKW